MTRKSVLGGVGYCAAPKSDWNHFEAKPKDFFECAYLNGAPAKSFILSVSGLGVTVQANLASEHVFVLQACALCFFDFIFH